DFGPGFVIIKPISISAKMSDSRCFLQEELHPTMQLSSQECDRTLDPFSTVHRFILTPSSTTTPAPMVTFGPMVQSTEVWM
uniref:Uncharacterized protein n=1 Tax=Poecilia mexicana TaxID=48701 RepID=A0A3B3WP21_9TELE